MDHNANRSTNNPQPTVWPLYNPVKISLWVYNKPVVTNLAQVTNGDANFSVMGIALKLGPVHILRSLIHELRVRYLTATPERWLKYTHLY